VHVNEAPTASPRAADPLANPGRPDRRHVAGRNLLRV